MAESIRVRLPSPCKQLRKAPPCIIQPMASRRLNRLGYTPENLRCLRARSLRQKLLRTIWIQVPKRVHGLQMQRARLEADPALWRTGNLMREVERRLRIPPETAIPEPWLMDPFGLPDGSGMPYSLTALMTM